MMKTRSLLPFDRSNWYLDTLKQLPLPKNIYNVIAHSSYSEIGQWWFSKDDLEILSLYVREGPMQKFCEYCLIKHEDMYLNKGVNYFKKYPKRYGNKQFLEFIEQITQLLVRINGFKFEEEDMALKAKVQLTIVQELLNHLAWGMYLACQAAGVRKSFTAAVSFNELQALKECVLIGARIFLEVLTNSKPNLENSISALNTRLQKGGNFKFISTIANKRNIEELFFKERIGSKELVYAIYGMLLETELAKQNQKVDMVIAPYYDGLTAAALCHEILSSGNNKPGFSIHIFADHSDWIDCGHWQGKTQREIQAKLSSLPPLVRPESNIAGKNIAIVHHALIEDVLLGIANFYEQLGANSVLLACAEAPGSVLSTQMPFSFQKRTLFYPPIAEYLGALPLHQFCKSLEKHE